MSSSMYNLLEAYSAVYNQDVREDLDSQRDYISEMQIGNLTKLDLVEIAEDVVEIMLSSGISIKESQQIIGSLFTKSNITGRQQKIDRLQEAFQTAFRELTSKASNTAVEEFGKYRNSKKLQESWSARFNQDKRVERVHNRLVAEEIASTKELLILMIEEKDDSYLETDMKKRAKNNEKALADMKTTKAHKDMVGAARRAMGIGEALDPVGEEDDDVDNDGDSDESDEYLKKRRKAISKSMKKRGKKKEDDEKLNEADSLAAMQARREKRLKAQRKREGTTAAGNDFGHNYSLTPAQQKARRDAEYKAGMKKEEVEEYVDFLIDEGYDCSELTWEEIAEEYESLDEGLRSAVKRLLGKKDAPAEKKPESRGEQLRKKYNVGPERSDTSAKRQILDRTRARAERDQRDYGGSRYSKSVADKSKAAHDRYLRGGYSKYGADDRRGSGNKARKRAAALKNEEFDVFDMVMEFLQVEGYVDTLEEAEWMMANLIDEEAVDIILGEEQLDEISQKTATRAYAASRTGEFEGADSDRDLKRSDNLEKHIKRKFGDKAVKHAERAAEVQTFGRKDASGRLKQSPQPRIQTSDHENQREFKRELRIRRDRRLRAKEDVNEADSVAKMRERSAKRRQQRYGKQGGGGYDYYKPLTQADYERGEKNDPRKKVKNEAFEAWLDEAMTNYEKNRKRAAQRAAARNAARDQGKTGVVPGVGYVTPGRERETWTDESGKTRHAKGL